MFIFKNALISISRNKGRNVLIGIIILVIACASTITLAINNTASDLINSYESAYDKELGISFDRKNMTKDIDFSERGELSEAKERLNDISAYTISDVEEFAKSDYIEGYYYTYSISLNGNNIEKAESESLGNSPEMPGPPGSDMFSNLGDSSYDFTLNGYSSVDAMSEFMEGAYEMVEILDNAWDKIFDGNYVFINEELASYNDLKLNDKIKLEDSDGNTYKFEIVGIYKENESGVSGPMGLFSNSANTIITNADSLIAIAGSNSSIKGTVSPTFIIKDYNDADKIQSEFYEKGLDKNYVVETNEEATAEALSSVENVRSFATTFLIITLIIGGVVLLVINVINIRERKYEIGVLRTIGISKAKLTMQFVSELLIVGFVALMIGAGIGAVMSKNVSNSLLSNEIKSSESSLAEVKGNFGGPGGFDPMENGPMQDIGMKGRPKIEAYESIDAVVDMKVLLELLGIGLTLILISSLSAMISIQRFTPLTILKERS